MSAFVVSNRNIVIPGPAGTQPCRLTRGYMGPVPDWVPETDYFKALEADGKVVRSQSRRDRDVRKAKAAKGERDVRKAKAAKGERDVPGE